MYLKEYQAKAVLSKAGLPVPRGRLASRPIEAVDIFRELGPVMVKAQVRAGGRGKAGLIGQASSVQEAEDIARRILGAELSGEPVRSVLVEEMLAVQQELYAAVVLNAARCRPEVMLSVRGGMDIEQVAEDRPEAVIRIELDPLADTSRVHHWVTGWKQAGLAGRPLSIAAGITAKLVDMFYRSDAITIEINPLVLVDDGRLLAADAKMIIDDSALFRHPELADFGDDGRAPLEERARRAGVVYVSLSDSGNAGIIAGGAGLSMATMDGMVDAGIQPAAFLDLGGGISEEGMETSLAIMLDTPGLAGMLVNVFGGINNCEIMARGIARAYDRMGVVPLVVKMRGHSQEAGWAILEEKGVNLVKHGTTEAAIRQLAGMMHS